MHIVAHYGEIALKGKNRGFFEKQLINNISEQFESQYPKILESIRQEYGRIILTISEKADIGKIKDVMRSVFGIVHFEICQKCDSDLEEMKKACLEIAKKADFETFRISTIRSNKNFPMTSEKINREIGAFIFENIENKKVKLKGADLDIRIEIAEKDCFISKEVVKGAGGMPVGTAGKAMVLLSGGIDSPVAAYYAMKRGLSVRFVHFHSMPYTSKSSVEKVTLLAKTLKNFKAVGKLYLVPFADIQKQVMLNCPDRLRIIIYRRIMLKIAGALARKEKASALVTGDSLAQVASQTLENLSVVGEASDLLLIRPLICMDKEEIMDMAKKIGTYETSIIPHDDCCTRLMPKKPEIRAELENVLEAEKNLDIENMVQEATKNTEIVSV